MSSRLQGLAPLGNRPPARLVLFPLGLNLPGVFATSPDPRAKPVDDEYRDADKNRETEEHPRRVPDTELVVHWAGVERADACEYIARKTVTASRRRRVSATVSSHHVVNGRKVDAQIGAADQNGKEERSNPWHRGTIDHKGGAEQTNRKEQDDVLKKP